MTTTSADMAPPAVTMGQKPVQGPPAHAVGGFTMQLPTVTLKPGEEQFPCYVMPIELKGPSRLIGGAVLHVQPGMHHGNVTTRPIDANKSCDSKSGFGEAVDVALGGAVAFASTTQIDHDEWQHFPDGMAWKLPKNNELVARLHYLNASPAPVTLSPSYEWFTIDEAALTQELAPFAWKYGEFTLPAMSDTTLTAECNFNHAMHVVTALPHMHRMGRGFGAGFVGGPLDGKPWLASKGYDPENGVWQTYQPGIDLGQGTPEGLGASFSCSFHNDLDFDVHEGVGDNEMCVLFGYGWPLGATYSALAGDGWCQIIASGDPVP